MDESATTKFKPPPIVLAIGLDAALSKRCGDILQLGVVNFDSAKEALDRITIVRPLVVVVGAALPVADVEELRMRCVDLTAELVTLPPKNGRSLELELRAAARAARIQRAEIT